MTLLLWLYTDAILLVNLHIAVFTLLDGTKMPLSIFEEEK